MKHIYTILLIVLSGMFSKISGQTFSFTYTGTVQSWTVPPGVTSVGVDARGAEGGMAGPVATLPTPSLTTPGKGGQVRAQLTVVPGQVLLIYVGGAGVVGATGGAAGGWNGGGSVTTHLGVYSGGGGGGASDIRVGGVALTDRVIVAAGGGGAGYNSSCPTADQVGGNGGGLTGFSVTTCPLSGYTITFATGGTQTAGGLGGWVWAPFGMYVTGLPGTLGLGGNTGTAPGDPGIAGGGGGGYYGGGGGCWMGGGGGSSYADGALTNFVTHNAGMQSGNGQVDICIVDPGAISGIYPICPGTTITLRESVTGGVWSSSNTAVATIGSSTGDVTGVAGGTTMITYTLSTTCATVFTTKMMTIIPAPAPISGVNPVCAGNTEIFTDATPLGRWTISSTAAATISSTGVVKGIYPGSAVVTYTEPTAGCYSVYPFNVNGITGVSNVCHGLSVPLGFSTGAGAWSSSDTLIAKVDPTGIVTGMGIGTATISYSNSVCPSAIIMHVNPTAPNLGVTDICVKGTGYVTNIVGGGTWSSSNASIVKAGSGTGLVTGVTAGTATVSYMTPNGCLSTSVVTVTDAPPAITGFAEVCPDKTTTLANIIGGGTWSSLNPGVATVGAGSGVVKGLVSDTTSILYTIFPGCATYRTVTVNPIPLPITGGDTLCPGVTDTLFTKSIGGLWSTSTPNLDTIVDSNGIITTRLSGMAVVTYTMPTGCSRSRNVYIYPVPTPKVTYNAFTKTFYTDLGYPGYQWYDSVSGKIPKAVSPSLAATYSQWYFVVITDTNGCKLKSDTLHHDIRVAGVGNVGGIAVHIYPNPVSGKLFIESPIAVRAIISTVDGKQVMEERNAKEMDLSMLASAPYFISLYDESGQLVSVQKIIKE